MRQFVAAIAAAALLLGSVGASAQSVKGDVGAGYVPADKDERGLWLQMEEEERKLQTSDFVIRDPELNAYVRGVLCRTVGDDNCKAARIYIMRVPQPNATMAPTGMMQIWSGLFLRVRDEAQLSAVLGHEYAHYRERHTLQLWRSIRGKMGAAAWMGFFGVFGSLAQLAMIGSVFEFSRDMEAEADTASFDYLVKAGYEPMAPARFWEQQRAEMDATAAARNKKSRKDKTGGMFATHPPSAERMATLRSLAQKSGKTGNGGRDSYRAALASFWAQFVDDQIKMNDFGATEFLLADLARESWTPELLYARGELYRGRGKADDLKQAAGFYRQAIAAEAPPPEAWRGLGLALIRSGDTDNGQAALRDYLTKRPDAGDRAMISMLAGGTK